MVSNSPVGSAQELTAQLVTELPVRSLAESLSFYRAAGFTVERATASFGALRFGDRYSSSPNGPRPRPAPTPRTSA